MSHEAMLARGPNDEWVLYFTAKAVANTGLPASGEDDDNIHGTLCTRSDRNSKCSCPSGTPDAGSQDPTWMSYTTTPLNYSSWSTPVKVIDPMANTLEDETGQTFYDAFCVEGTVPAQGDQEPASSIDTNFNGVINDDGSFVGLWRTWQSADDLCSENGYATLGGATGIDGDVARFSVPHAVKASDWTDVSSYTYLVDNDALESLPVEKKRLKWIFESQYDGTQAARGIEDPMIYKDDNGVYRTLMWCAICAFRSFASSLIAASIFRHNASTTRCHFSRHVRAM